MYLLKSVFTCWHLQHPLLWYRVRWSCPYLKRCIWRANDNDSFFDRCASRGYALKFCSPIGEEVEFQCTCAKWHNRWLKRCVLMLAKHRRRYLIVSMIIPDWNAPKNVKAFASTRFDGCSTGAYQGLNLENTRWGWQFQLLKVIEHG